MSIIIQGYQLRTLVFGSQVIKGPAVLPQTTTSNLFTVSGGAVLVTSLLGLVTTVMTSTDPQLTIGTAPTTGTAETSGIATSTTLASLEVGTWIGVQASAGLAGALVSGAHAGNAVWLPTPFLVSAGTITLKTLANNTTGQIKWYLSYVPLDTGAAVS